jgi:4-deoxy-L-threo-5-hexosulose-uronate ketol-isomerase
LEETLSRRISAGSLSPMFERSIRRMPRQDAVPGMSSQELRDAFLVEGVFAGGGKGVFTDLDRLVLGGAVPGEAPVDLPDSPETGRDHFLERRELGAINVGGPGAVHVDGKTFSADTLSCVYAGAGTRRLVFESRSPENPAKFFFLSCPAHAPFPPAALRRDEAVATPLGSQENANRRVIRKFIHEGGIRSCQLVMGYTELAEGSVWNSFPPHTHSRRSEIYFYFNLGDRVLAHFMGEPGATRHLFVHDEQAVCAPSWSIHCGCGTGSYSFIWGMAGENQRFDDMDPVSPGDLL